MSCGRQRKDVCAAWVFSVLAAFSIAAGNSVAEAGDGSIVAWGRDDEGQTNVPLPNDGFVAVSAGEYHSLGLKGDGSVVAWGSNQYGQATVPLLNTGFVAIAAGGYHSIGLRSDGTVAVWGRHVEGYGPELPSPNAGFARIAGGDDHSLGLKLDGSAVAWGWGCDGPQNWGQCSVPSPNVGFHAVSAGSWHSLALKSDGSIVAWGCEFPVHFGECDSPMPNTEFVDIAASRYFYNVGLKGDGSVTPWGGCTYPYNFGQCNVPQPNTGFVSVSAPAGHVLGLIRDGQIVAWGRNDYGQINVPAPNTGFVAVAAGGFHSLAIKGGGACCLASGTCLQLATQSLCDAQSGVFHGLGSSCGGDLDGDLIADTCDQCPFDPTNTKTPEGQCIPTVSQWGLIVMAGLVAAAGGSILRKRRQAGNVRPPSGRK